MKIEQIKTGIAELDSDLTEFLELYQSERLTEVRSAIQDPSVERKIFIDLVPDSLFRLYLNFVKEDISQELFDRISDKSRGFINEVGEIILRELDGILDHPVTRARRMIDQEIQLASISTNIEKVGRYLLNDRRDPNTVREISYSSSFAGIDGRLKPSVRLLLQNQVGKPLLDTTAEWDDLLFLAQGLITILVKEMDTWLDVYRKGVFEITEENKQQIAEQLSALRVASESLFTFVNHYDITVPERSADEK